VSILGAMGREVVDLYEQALRRLPESCSLALRLKAAGVADAVVCEYLHIDPEGLGMFLHVAAAKLAAELHPLAYVPAASPTGS